MNYSGLSWWMRVYEWARHRRLGIPWHQTKTAEQIGMDRQAVVLDAVRALGFEPDNGDLVSVLIEANTTTVTRESVGARVVSVYSNYHPLDVGVLSQQLTVERA